MVWTLSPGMVGTICFSLALDALANMICKDDFHEVFSPTTDAWEIHRELSRGNDILDKLNPDALEMMRNRYLWKAKFIHICLDKSGKFDGWTTRLENGMYVVSGELFDWGKKVTMFNCAALFPKHIDEYGAIYSQSLCMT